MAIILIIYLFIGTFLMMGTMAIGDAHFYDEHGISVWKAVPFMAAITLLAILLFWPLIILWPERK